MAVPKKRSSTQRKGLRRAGQTHKLYTRTPIMTCPNCQAPTVRNRVCPACGYYKGRPVLLIKTPESEEAPGGEAEGQTSSPQTPGS